MDIYNISDVPQRVLKTPTYLVNENKSGQIKGDYVLVFRFTQAFQNLFSFLKSTIDDCVFKHEKNPILGLKSILPFLWIGGWKIVKDIFALSPTLLCDPIYLVFSFLLWYTYSKCTAEKNWKSCVKLQAMRKRL